MRRDGILLDLFRVKDVDCQKEVVYPEILVNKTMKMFMNDKESLDYPYYFDIQARTEEGYDELFTFDPKNDLIILSERISNDYIHSYFTFDKNGELKISPIVCDGRQLKVQLLDYYGNKLENYKYSKIYIRSE